MRVTAIVVNYARPLDTYKCVSALLRSRHIDVDVIVIDNGSHPPLDMTTDFARHIHVVHLPQNRGFSGGYNYGLRLALQEGAERIFVVNNDAVVDPDALFELTNALGSTDGVITPRIYYAGDASRIWSDGFMAHPWTMEMYGGRRGELDTGAWPESRRVDYVLGCAFLVTRGVLEKVGLFDERFFAYYEDLDFSLRVRAAGFPALVKPTAKVWHSVSATSGWGTPRRQYLMAFGSIVFLIKHAGRRWPLMAGVRLVHLARTVAVSLVTGRWDLMCAQLSGLRDGWLAMHSSHAQ